MPGSKRRFGAQRQRGRKVKNHVAVRHGDVFLAEYNASHAAGREKRLGVRLAEFFFHHHAGRNGRQRRAQPLAVAVGLVVAAAGRRFCNGVWDREYER